MSVHGLSEKKNSDNKPPPMSIPNLVKFDQIILKKSSELALYSDMLVVYLIPFPSVRNKLIEELDY